MRRSPTKASCCRPSPIRRCRSEFRRQIVVDPTGEQPGTIVVKLNERLLYYVLPGGEALRYGVGIGRDGFRWSGRANIQYGKKWPVWTPPPEMIARKPELEKWRSGQPGGLDNPLGARAMYIYKNERTPATACTARRNGGRSARRCRRAACA